MALGLYNVIDEGAELGDGVTVGHHNVIHADVVIEGSSTVGSFCEIESGTRIADCTIVQGRVRIGKKCSIGRWVIIKYGAILTQQVTVMDKVFIGPNVIMLGGKHDRSEQHGTFLSEGCYIGAATQIAAGVTIARNVVVGANSFVSRDITVPGIYAGTPAKFIKPL